MHVRMPSSAHAASPRSPLPRDAAWHVRFCFVVSAVEDASNTCTCKHVPSFSFDAHVSLLLSRTHLHVSFATKPQKTTSNTCAHVRSRLRRRLHRRGRVVVAWRFRKVVCLHVHVFLAGTKHGKRFPLGIARTWRVRFVPCRVRGLHRRPTKPRAAHGAWRRHFLLHPPSHASFEGRRTVPAASVERFGARRTRGHVVVQLQRAAFRPLRRASALLSRQETAQVLSFDPHAPPGVLRGVRRALRAAKRGAEDVQARRNGRRWASSRRSKPRWR